MTIAAGEAELVASPVCRISAACTPYRCSACVRYLRCPTCAYIEAECVHVCVVRCTLENATSSELLVRLTPYPKMKAALDVLPPKMLALSSSEPAKPVELHTMKLETRVKEVAARIQVSTFTSGADKLMVTGLYKEYVGRIATTLQKTLALSGIVTQEVIALPPPPAVTVPTAAPLCLSDGQPLLLLYQDGSTRFGVVAGGRVSCTLAGGDEEITFDGCVQAALPWRPPAPGWEEKLLHQVEVLPALEERTRQLDAEVRARAGKAMSAATAPAVEACVRSIAAEAVSLAEAAQAQPIKEMGEAIHAKAEEALNELARDQPEAASQPSQAAAGAVQSLLAQLAQLQPEALAATALRATGGMGARRYRPGQWLTVRAKGKWVDAEVAEGGVIVTSDGQEAQLHPWNHAPRELPCDSFEVMRAWWKAALRKQHQYIHDALTGKPLRVLDQTVPIDVLADAELAGIKSALDLGYKLTELHTKCCLGLATERPAALLLEGPPASGKTCLMSQVVMRTLQQDETVPILVKIQQLQRRKLQSPDAFAVAWNWIDAYLRLEYDEAVYGMLRQVRSQTPHSHTQRPDRCTPPPRSRTPPTAP